MPGFQEGVIGLNASHPFDMVIENQCCALRLGNAADQPAPEHETRIVALFERLDVVADRVEPDLLEQSNAG